MTTQCQICNVQPFKYKCPTCYVKYCSLLCFKTHKESSPCEKPSLTSSANLPGECQPLTYKFPTSDTVPIEKLQALVQSDELKECLSNPYVRDILKSLVQSQTPEASIKEAMKEPIFLELAHACLKIVEPEKFHHELGSRGQTFVIISVFKLVLRRRPQNRAVRVKSLGSGNRKKWERDSSAGCRQLDRCERPQTFRRS